MKKVLIGCGIVALLAVIAVVGTTMWMVNLAKQATPNTERLSAMEQRMVEAHGEPNAFVPPLDGQYDPARVALYLDARDRLLTAAQPFRAELESARALAESQEGGGFLSKLRHIKGNIRAGIGSLRSSVNYVGTADSVLVELGMGKGEYLHYNLLLLFDRLPDEVIAVATERPKDPEFEETMVRAFLQHGEDLVLDQFDNARRQVGALSDPTPEQEAWRKQLYEVIADSRGDEGVLPFRHGLPVSLQEAFAQHEVRIEASLPRDLFSSIPELVLAMEVEDNGGIQVNVDR